MRIEGHGIISYPRSLASADSVGKTGDVSWVTAEDGGLDHLLGRL